LSEILAKYKPENLAERVEESAVGDLFLAHDTLLLVRLKTLAC